MDKTGKKISELLADYPKMFSTPELRVDCPDSIKFRVIDEIHRRFGTGKTVQPSIGEFKIVNIDGVRAEWSDGWGGQEQTMK